MGKHKIVICFRCGKPSGASHMSEVYGCRTCKAALSEAQRKELHDALIERNRAKRQAAREAEEAQAALQTQFTGQPEADDVFSQMKAQRLAQGPSQVQLQSKITEQSLVQQIVAEANYVAKVDKAMADLGSTVRRCVCCCVPWHASDPAYIETYDGKLLCYQCAYGVLRCGACPIHSNVIYPDIAAKIPRIHPREYPPDVLAPFDPKSFPD